jgi:hypothetical protein
VLVVGIGRGEREEEPARTAGRGFELGGKKGGTCLRVKEMSLSAARSS